MSETICSCKALCTCSTLGWNNCLRNVVSSLREYPRGGGDIKVMQEVERIIFHAVIAANALREKADHIVSINKVISTVVDHPGAAITATRACAIQILSNCALRYTHPDHFCNIRMKPQDAIEQAIVLADKMISELLKTANETPAEVPLTPEHKALSDILRLPSSDPDYARKVYAITFDVLVDSNRNRIKGNMEEPNRA